MPHGVPRAGNHWARRVLASRLGSARLLASMRERTFASVWPAGLAFGRARSKEREWGSEQPHPAAQRAFRIDRYRHTRRSGVVRKTVCGSPFLPADKHLVSLSRRVDFDNTVCRWSCKPDRGRTPNRAGAVGRPRNALHGWRRPTPASDRRTPRATHRDLLGHWERESARRRRVAAEGPSAVAQAVRTDHMA